MGGGRIGGGNIGIDDDECGMIDDYERTLSSKLSSIVPLILSLLPLKDCEYQSDRILFPSFAVVQERSQTTFNFTTKLVSFAYFVLLVFAYILFVVPTIRIIQSYSLSSIVHNPIIILSTETAGNSFKYVNHQKFILISHQANISIIIIR